MNNSFGQPKSSLVYEVAWYYSPAHDRIGFKIKKFRYVIFHDVMTDSWRISNVKGLWKFTEADLVKWADLPAWFQASAPHWKDHFSKLVNPHTTLRAMP